MADPEIELQSISISTPPAPSASTSASTPLDCCGYDVFINHRGPDVKNTFASHLYGRLLQRGLRAFLDKRELQEGQNLTLQIQRAIRTATVHVAIFSPTYAQSKWCLDELLQMWEMCESGAIIIPVFYHVKPAQLRWTQGAGGVYSEDLRKLEEKKTYDTQTHQEKPRHDPDTIQKWRKVLSDVSEISGFELDANNTDEGEVLDKIVESVVKNVKKRNLDEAAEDSENTALLEQQQQNRGKLDVLSFWCGKLHAYGLGLFGIILILKLLGLILAVAFFIFWVRSFLTFSSNFPKNSSNIPYHFPKSLNLGTPPGSFTVWQISSATAQAIWWPLQLFFILFMNMTVLYIL